MFSLKNRLRAVFYFIVCYYFPIQLKFFPQVLLGFIDIDLQFGLLQDEHDDNPFLLTLKNVHGVRGE